MDRQAATGRWILALALLLFAAQHFFFASGSALPPIGPPFVTGSPVWGWLVGALLLVTAVSLASGRAQTVVASTAGFGCLLYGIAVYLPPLIDKIRSPGPWTSGAEMISLAGGLIACSAGQREPERAGPFNPEAVFRVGSWLYALTLFVYSAQHLMYGRFVATLVPAWIPGHLFWAYAIGIAFAAAGLSILFNRAAILAASLLGLQFLLWVVLLHLPRALAATPSGNEWSSLGMALAMGGGAWVIAGTLRKRERA